MVWTPSLISAMKSTDRKRSLLARPEKAAAPLPPPSPLPFKCPMGYWGNPGGGSRVRNGWRWSLKYDGVSLAEQVRNFLSLNILQSNRQKKPKKKPCNTDGLCSPKAQWPPPPRAPGTGAQAHISRRLGPPLLWTFRVCLLTCLWVLLRFPVSTEEEEQTLASRTDLVFTVRPQCCCELVWHSQPAHFLLLLDRNNYRLSTSDMITLRSW